MKKKNKMKNFKDWAPLKETLKQKIQLKAQRIRQYDKRSKFYRQNSTFKMENKKFYRELGKTQVNVEKPPSKEEVEKFWTSIWCTEKEFNEEAEWLKREEEQWEGLEQQEWEEIKEVKLKESLRKAQKWKSPGIEKVPNFWLKSLDSIHGNITNCYNRAITNPETNPRWFIKKLHIYYLNSRKQTSTKTIDLSPAYQPRTKS